MRIEVKGLQVLFPYDYIYPEQYQYMVELKETLDASQHCLLEMPSGTGKTATILSLFVAYQQANPKVGKLIYCSRTVPEIEKALLELKKLIAYYKKENQTLNKFLGLGLSSRRKMCIHPKVSISGDGKTIDGNCLKLTASWVRKSSENNNQIELCSFFENFEKIPKETCMPMGVYTLDDLRNYGKEKEICPYFLTRNNVLLSFLTVLLINR